MPHGRRLPFPSGDRPTTPASMKAIQERGQGAIAYMHSDEVFVRKCRPMCYRHRADTSTPTYFGPARRRQYDFAAEIVPMGITPSSYYQQPRQAKPTSNTASRSPIEYRSSWASRPESVYVFQRREDGSSFKRGMTMRTNIVDKMLLDSP